MKKTFNNACLLTIEARTNGYQGGDAGHGCESVLGFQMDGAMEVRVRGTKVELVFGGDAELEGLIEGLRWAAESLKEQSQPIKDRAR